ncbi:MAG: PQQ-binding-like beta-propeller repeat protein, partial [Pseudomonadota bacterium]
TLDANGLVRAFNVSSGARVWQVSLIPESERSAGSGSFTNALSFSSSSKGGYGGGLAADNGRLFAASGFGRVVALDPATGKQLWERSLGTPVRAAPTAVGDRVFVVTTEGRFFCLSGVDGAELWAVRGIPQQASRVINVSPAVDGNLVVVPYPSGDLMALNVADGAPAWTESLARSRAGSELASLSDAARPVIDNGTVFAVGHGGRMIATLAGSGERLWSINVAGTQAPWVSGDSVFVVDTAGRLLAVSRDTGAVRWTTKLPGAKMWSGPTMAANQLWLVSDQGALIGVDALTGRVATQQSVGSKMFIPPIVAQGRMLLLTDSAQLVAYN